jgi:hypothetical protein
VARAASAFTDAFTLTNTVAVGIALAAAAAVLVFSPGRGKATEADEATDETIDLRDVELGLLPVGVEVGD